MLYINQYEPPRGLGFECASLVSDTALTLGMTWEKETEDILILTSLSLWHRLDPACTVQMLLVQKDVQGRSTQVICPVHEFDVADV